MPLGDILAARALSARARGTVEAGTLGTVTVEALPVRELERLSRGADGDRAVFYAACRELQGVGAALLRAGRVYRPDEVTALVSDAEAARAAEAVRALSGWTARAGETGEKAADALPAERTVRGSAGADGDADTGAEHSDRSRVRPRSDPRACRWRRKSDLMPCRKMRKSDVAACRKTAARTKSDPMPCGKMRRHLRKSDKTSCRTSARADKPHVSF